MGLHIVVRGECVLYIGPEALLAYTTKIAAATAARPSRGLLAASSEAAADLCENEL